MTLKGVAWCGTGFCCRVQGRDKREQALDFFTLPFSCAFCHTCTYPRLCIFPSYLRTCLVTSVVTQLLRLFAAALAVVPANLSMNCACRSAFDVAPCGAFFVFFWPGFLRKGVAVHAWLLQYIVIYVFVLLCFGIFLEFSCT